MGRRRGDRGRPPPPVGRELDKSQHKHPRKRMYRARAHSNPLNDAIFDVPTSPAEANWHEHFPAILPPQQEGNAVATQEAPVVRFADLGCGFGGLLIQLATRYPETLMVGMEIRDKVAEYVKERIIALRRDNPGQYQNCSIVRTNAQRYLANYFMPGQLTKLFFLFPDPHFKAANHRRRIIQPSLLTEYAHFMAPGGLLYTITDVEELGDWMREHLAQHPMFDAVGDDELENDVAAQLLGEASEEAQKVLRNGGKMHRAVFRRRLAPLLREPLSGS